MPSHIHLPRTLNRTLPLLIHLTRTRTWSTQPLTIHLPRTRTWTPTLLLQTTMTQTWTPSFHLRTLLPYQSISLPYQSISLPYPYQNLSSLYLNLHHLRTKYLLKHLPIIYQPPGRRLQMSRTLRNPSNMNLKLLSKYQNHSPQEVVINSDRKDHMAL